MTTNFHRVRGGDPANTGRFSAAIRRDNTVHLAATAPRVPDYVGATSMEPGAAARAASSTDPVVRALAFDGWDLDEGDRERLAGDGQVQRVLARLTA